jgi:hypothetical protein
MSDGSLDELVWHLRVNSNMVLVLLVRGAVGILVLTETILLSLGGSQE